MFLQNGFWIMFKYNIILNIKHLIFVCCIMFLSNFYASIENVADVYVICADVSREFNIGRISRVWTHQFNFGLYSHSIQSSLYVKYTLQWFSRFVFITSSILGKSEITQYKHYYIHASWVVLILKHKEINIFLNTFWFGTSFLLSLLVWASDVLNQKVTNLLN